MPRQAVRKIRHTAGEQSESRLPVTDEALNINEHLDALLNASFDGFVVTDAEARVLKINKAYTRITGIREEEMLGHSMVDLLRRGLVRHSVTLEVVKHRIPITMLHSYRTGNIALVTGTPVFDQGGALCLVIVNVRDITQLNGLRERLGQPVVAGQENESIFLRPELADLPAFGMVVHSEQMKRCLWSALRVAKYDSPVLVLGESGVGKGCFARLIHDASPRRDGPFIHLNCGSIPETLVESELFGYERGAFTGALASGKPGQFELAQNGTIFLDEVGELSLSLQVKLLDVIEEKLVRRVGGNHSIAINARLIAATNRDLEAMVGAGKFREDLFFRLNVVPLKIPPLRERQEEVPLLINAFMESLAKRYGTRKRLQPRVLATLTRYQYPGNVRELENILERLVILSESDTIDDRHLTLCGLPATRPVVPIRREGSLRQIVDAFEARVLREAVESAPTLRQVASRLEISVPTLWRKLKRHGLQTV
ncbi:MAG: sigma 54-interacting transcriptional regulator [Candidatus Rokubacteria bacterium]|nr:sigma 54-interacting transcriptional regulator [Candidatus Rokubacteria bacterium]